LPKTKTSLAEPFSNKSMAADPITGIANALVEGFRLFQPVVDDAVKQKYEKAHQERLREWNELLSEADSDRRVCRMAGFVLRLLADSGSAVGGVAGTSVEVPLDVLNALITECSESVRNQALINKLQFK
jgi:hypothetical protein